MYTAVYLIFMCKVSKKSSFGLFEIFRVKVKISKKFPQNWG